MQKPSTTWYFFKAFLRGSQCQERGFTPWFDVSPLWFQERYRKALADSENVRRRTQKFVEDAKLFGKQKSCVYLTGLPDWAEKMLISSFSVPLSCPPSFVSKPAVMFGLDSWYLGLITIFFSVSSCVLSYQVYPQNHRIVTILFFFLIVPVQLSLVVLTWLKMQAMLCAEDWLWQGVFYPQLCHQVMISFTRLTASSASVHWR